MPFIDLLSTLVLFLLVTAVWLQVSVIPASTKSESGTSSAAPSTKGTMRIRLTREAMEVVLPENLGNLIETLPLKDGSYAWTELSALTSKSAAELEGAQISSEDGIAYGQVIKAIDTLKGAGIASVALKTE